MNDTGERETIVDPDGNKLGYSQGWESPAGRTLDPLMDQGRIRLGLGQKAFIYTERPPLPASTKWDRMEGMLLGLAIGDALGKGSEGLVPRDRRLLFGEVRDYQRLRRARIDDGRGYPSDDSQMAFWTLEQMVEDGGFDPERLAQKFASGQIYGIGATVSAFLECRQRGLSWQECGQESAGNGALMRIAPMVIPHLRSTSADLWAETALSAMVTHNDYGAIASAVAFVNMLWRLLAMEHPPEPEWYPRMFGWVAGDLEGEAVYQPRGGEWAGDYAGPLGRFAVERVMEAYRRGLPVVDACNSWHSGAYLMETVPSVLYILMRHGHDPEEAIVRAVNDTFDNDTVGAIVGAAVGALHGRSALPERWITWLSGRTREADDGRMFQLLEEARRLWWCRDEEAGGR